MLNQPAEQSFQKGLRALSAGRTLEAAAFFEAAIELEKRYKVEGHQARYLSYYGFCLGLVRGKYHEALDLCRGAVDMEPYNPDLYLNLGRVLLAADRRRDAYAALLNGLGMHPDHVPIRRELEAMGLRRRPVLPFLARTNPLNVVLGRMRNS